MAAPAGYKSWSTGDSVSATEFQTYIQDQIVGVFADDAARTTALASPSEGQVSFLKDTNTLEIYDGTAWVTIADSDMLSFNTTTDVVTIGKGTGSPAGYLQVHSAADGTPSIRIISTNGTTSERGFLSVDSANNHVQLGYYAGGVTGAVTVQSDGKVGIGTATPQKILHVEESDSGATPGSTHHAVFESSADIGLLIASGTANNGFIRFGDSASATSGGFDYDHADDSLKIRTAGTDHITINSSGNMTVGGTTQPGTDADFYVEGTSSFYNPTAGTSSILLKAYSDVGGTESLKFDVRADGDITTDGGITAAGQVGIGTTAPRAPLNVKLSTGIAGTPSTGTWAAEVYHAANAPGANGLLVLNNWGATNSTVLEAGGINAVTGGFTSLFKVDGLGNVAINGSLSKGSGSFDIPHPIKGGDWRLRHSFIEGPQADLIYRGTVTLVNGSATVDLDEKAGMTDGTWEALCRDPWSMASSSGNTVEWVLDGKTLTITSATLDAVCPWIVMAERQDDHMASEDCPLTGPADDPAVIVEYERPPEVDEPVETPEPVEVLAEANKQEPTN